MEVKKVLEQVEKGNIRFITLQFTDLLGVIKEIIIPVEQFEDASRNGVWFDGSSIEGFAGNRHVFRHFLNLSCPAAGRVDYH
jgi:glutamine synthetase